MKISELHLSDTARHAAEELLKAHPDVVFTSGRRDLPGQAEAMAQNVVRVRDWIEQTYVATPQRNALQDWVDRHPGTGLATVRAGLLGLMEQWTDAELAHVSKHLSGDAFDVHPVAGAHGEAIKATIRALPGVTKFLDHEAGLTIWHVQTA